LALRTLVRLWNVNPGFNPRNVLTFGFSLSPSTLQTNPAAIRESFRAADSAVASAPGVQSVSLSWGAFPMSGDDEWLFWLDGEPKPTTTNEMNWVIDYVVDPDYLKIMQTPLRSGRFFTARDDEHSPPVIVIDDVFARQYFAGENPVGKRLFLNIGQSNMQAQIIGVVAHVNQWGLDTDDTERLRSQLYFPFLQLPDPTIALAPTGMRMVVRTDGAAPGAFDSIRQSLLQVNNEQVVYGAQTMSEVISDSTATRRFSAILLGSFALVALLLSGVGIYGVISYLIGQRTHEIGVRMALGAQQSKVLFQVLGAGLKLAITGAAIGLAAAFGLTRLMTSLLYGVSPTDPLTFAAVAVLLIVVALAACYIPARRAAAVDPMIALRHE
jgi:predicted permease